MRTENKKIKKILALILLICAIFAVMTLISLSSARPLMRIHFDSESWLRESAFNFEVDDWRDIPFIRPHIARTLQELPEIYTLNYSYSALLMSATLDRYVENELPFGNIIFDVETFGVIGVSTENLPHVSSGSIEIVEGRQFLENELIDESDTIGVMLSSLLAETNALSIGDEIQLYTFSEVQASCFLDETEPEYVINNDFALDTITINAVIIGLFDVPETRPFNAVSARQISDDREEALNTLYFPNWALKLHFYNVHQAQINSKKAICDGILPADFDVYLEDILSGEGIEVDVVFELNEQTNIQNFMADEHHLLTDDAQSFVVIHDAGSRQHQTTIFSPQVIIIMCLLLIASVIVVIFYLKQRKSNEFNFHHEHMKKQ
ncbi:MAG: hypothetical protein FWG67_08630 [Defluviitaleaceae bacterium]|nr:hypothetical protein [Defluviitaleaceae bacterium]